MALGWAQLQYDWNSYKKWRLVHRRAQSGNYVKTQGKMAIYKPRRKAIRRNQPCRQFDLDFWPPAS